MSDESDMLALEALATTELERQGLRDGVASAWLSGSLVESLGHSASDVDVFAMAVPGFRPPACAREDSGVQICVSFVNDRRVDVELWHDYNVELIAGKLRHILQVDQGANLLDFLSEHEVEFVHRLHVGRPLVAAERVQALRDELPKNALSHYLLENRRMYLDDAIDDTVGLLDAGDARGAAFRARCAAEFAVDMVLFSFGVTNDKAKHRLNLLDKLRQEHSALLPLSAEFWEFLSSMPRLAGEQRRYAQSALQFVELQMIGVYERWDSRCRTLKPSTSM